MNRAEFMRQLESLLQGVPAAEREEALQYYNDYFDDAGDESEQDVIEALGNPARVAENIKRDLLESGYGETPVKKALASERKVIEYGRQEAQQASEPPQEPQPQMQQTADTRAAGIGGGNSGTAGIGGTAGYGGNSGAAGYGGGSVPSANAIWPTDTQPPVNTGRSGEAGQSGKSGLPGWAWILIILGLVFGSPVLAGIAGTLFGAIAAWFCLILAMGMVTAALFIVLVVLAVVGIMCMPTDPVAGIALVGGGLICGSLGILCLMLTVVMAGVITPAIFKGIAFLVRSCRPGKKNGRQQD